jgi:hypothetical protein
MKAAPHFLERYGFVLAGCSIGFALTERALHIIESTQA